MPLCDGSSYVRAPRGSRVVSSCCGAPGGQPAVDPDLAAEDAGDSRREGPIGGLAARAIDEPEAIGPRHVADELQEVDHRVVVECDIAGVPRAGRVRLRPSAVRVLRGQQVVERPDEGVAASGPAGGDERPRQEPHLTDGRPVVEGAAEAGPVAPVRRRGRVNVLGPVPALRLVRQDILRQPGRLVAAVPGIGPGGERFPGEPGRRSVRGDRDDQEERREDRTNGASRAGHRIGPVSWEETGRTEQAGQATQTALHVLGPEVPDQFLPLHETAPVGTSRTPALARRCR